MKTKSSRGLMFRFTIGFIVFAIVILTVAGFATYFSQMRNYKEECENNIRDIGEYLAALMKNDGTDFIKYQDYFMNNYREMKIDYNFNSFEESRQQFVTAFSEKYAGKALGVDVQIEDTPKDIQEKYFIYFHKYWLLTFEKARTIFHLPYTYYIVMGDNRARIENLKEGQDKRLNVCYMIDGERTVDEEKSSGTDKYLYLGDTYYNGYEENTIEWNTWETGKRQDGFVEWDNDWGHTYSCYTPLIIDGKKLGLIGTEIEVETVNKGILMNTLRQTGIIAGIFLVGLIVMLVFIRLSFIRKALKLEDVMSKYSKTKDAAIADEVTEMFSGRDELDSLGREFASMVREVAEYMQKMIRANRQLEVSRKREHEMSELAIRDSLTGIRNKTAYDREVFKIEREIEDGHTNFGVAMCDLNYLKKINDNCGHEKGDMAIQKICRVICVTFAHSPVFRIGGDEFAIILKNSDYEDVDALIDKFNKELESLKQDPNAEMWEAPSAAIGYALYDEKRDHGSYESVFKRADGEMYRKKTEMKAVRE